ncbi:MAG TPA: hypothetical protein PLD25_12270 [Chloroflexota bacterium]|nr:hypothetical protein [Chloroflexota bacterium]HUM69228.1 hypothetical protein [Chloroflexota bacterium]
MEEIFGKALLVVPEAIIIVDNDHNVQFMNLAAVTLFEVSDPLSVLGNSFSMLPGGSGLKTYEQRIDFTNKVNEFALDKSPFPEPDDEQIWMTDGPNNHLFYFRAIPLKNEGNNQSGYVIRVNDKTYEQAAITYLGGIPFDMGAPLAMIQGFAELLLLEDSSHNLTEDQRQWISSIRDSVKKLEELRKEIRELHAKIKREQGKDAA